MKFRITKKSTESNARCGVMELAHGTFETPVFMPVGTQATVKAIDVEDVGELGFKIILSNTYHLFLRPGHELIEKAGGLHGFMNWPHNILTDSGGFQVFSLSKLRKILPEGVRFQSHIDGSKHILSPEKVVDVQTAFNSDIQMALDVCTEPGISSKKAFGARLVTTQWAARAKSRWLEKKDTGYKGVLFGIVQGNFYEDQRSQSALELGELDLPGYAIGGLSVGEEFPVFQHFLAFTAPLLPEAKPKYLMGIGTPEYILEAVENGIDMFDCVFPTRVARNGTFFTRYGRISIKQERYKNDLSPIEADGPISMYSRAYLRHLFRAGEMLGPMLATRHNLFFLKRMMNEIHAAIHADRFSAYKRDFLSVYSQGGNNE